MVLSRPAKNSYNNITIYKDRLGSLQRKQLKQNKISPKIHCSKNKLLFHCFSYVSYVYLLILTQISYVSFFSFFSFLSSFSYVSSLTINLKSKFVKANFKRKLRGSLRKLRLNALSRPAGKTDNKIIKNSNRLGLLQT